MMVSPGFDRACVRKVVQSAELILGAPSTLALLDHVSARKEALEPEMSLALEQVRKALKSNNPVLVSSGDPLFYGVARFLCDRLGKELFEVVPHVSSMATRHFCEGEGELGRRDAYQPCRPADRGRDRPDPYSREDRLVLERRTALPLAGRVSFWSAASITSAPTSAKTWARRTSE